jgi:predicted metalloprotease
MSRRTARSHSALPALTVVTVLLLALGCSRPVDNKPKADGGPPTVAGLPLTDGPSGPREGAPPAQLNVERATGNESDVLMTNSIADVQEYWRTEYPKMFHEELVPVNRFISYDPTKSGETLCGTPARSNASYWSECENGKDAIAWDRAKLIPELIENVSVIAPTVVLAHEYGHAVQHKSLLTTSSTPSLVLEQQADCFAGAFMRHVAEGKSEHFTLNTSDGLSAAMSAILAVRDHAADMRDNAGFMEHGPGFDRVSAFQIGFSDGPSACTKIDLDEIHKRRGDIPQVFTSSEDKGEEPVTEKSVATVIETLNIFFKLPQPPKVSYSGADQHCADAKPTAPVSYCPATNTLGIDMPGLVKLSTVTNEHLDPVVTGDFAAYVLLASRYALAVQKQAGESLDGDNAARRNGCYAGAWATGLASGAAGGNVTLSPGDLDEALSGLLTNGLVASDLNGAALKIGFDRVDAFRYGVTKGFAECRSHYSG